MNPAQVFLNRVPAKATTEVWAQAARRALAACDGLKFVKRNDFIALKLHVGEPGLKTFLPPPVTREVVALVKERGARPFLTDSAVLYSGPRSHGVGHAETAHHHGFTIDQVGAPFLAADGLEGNWERTVQIPGRIYQQVGIAAAIADANGMVVISHATGHLAAGFGATLKNLGMGCASRKGKLLQHSDAKPHIERDSCVSCGACIESCPVHSIHQDDQGKATIDESTCIGCGECIAQCRNDAVGFSWDSGCGRLQEKMVEHALGAMRAVNGRVVYLLGMVNITQECDCLAPGSKIVARDIGFAASTDPVALDQAAMDLIEKQEGNTLDRISHPRLDGTIQLRYAEQLGLGSRRYQLVEVA